jgi:uncharacterized protein (TIGR02452 family)
MNERLAKIYQETKEICSSITPPVSEKVTYDDHTPQAGIDTNLPDLSGNIIVEPMDTVSALIKYSKLGKTAVLNMASAKRPGGGVENGAMAQEECLFRCSDLFTIPKSFYPLKSDQFIYTKGASFVRDGQYNIMDPVIGDVITMSAINLNNEHIDYSDSGRLEYPVGIPIMDEYLYLDKMFYMINSALLNGCTNIILGAWGCGVFKNDPSVISDLFREVLDSPQGNTKLHNMFDNVVFAIINDHNSTGNNYQIFKDKFKN